MKGKQNTIQAEKNALMSKSPLLAQLVAKDPKGFTNEWADMPGGKVLTGLSFHLGNAVLHQAENAIQVHSQRAPPLLFAHFLDGNIFRRPDPVVRLPNRPWAGTVATLHPVRPPQPGTLLRSSVNRYTIACRDRCDAVTFEASSGRSKPTE